MSRLDQEGEQRAARADARDEALAEFYAPSGDPVHLVEAPDCRSTARPVPEAANALTQRGAILPAYPDELLALPHGLGEVQSWVCGFMSYPSLAVAGFVTWAVYSHFAMSSARLDSRRGLGVNEQFLFLAPTGYGKEDTRAPIEILMRALEEGPRPQGVPTTWLSHLPRIHHSMPASLQGMHRMFEAHRAATILSDEHAEWIAHASSESGSHKQQASQHAMQVYTRAFGTLAAPAAVTNEYRPVENPRLLIFATSTAERMLEVITASQADSGALNRFVIMPGEQGMIAKRYGVRSANFKPPAAVVELIAWLAAQTDIAVTFDAEAWALYEQHDAAVLDPLKFRDHRLAGRLNEQAFKLAALIALSDQRTTINAADLRVAYAIREGLYHRTAALIGYDGALSGMHTTGRALEQLRAHFEAKPAIYRSQLPKVSRQFAKLSLPEREAVIRAIQVEGIARLDGARFVSCVCAEEAP